MESQHLLKFRLSTLTTLVLLVFFASCSRESLQVQKWDKVDYQMASQQHAVQPLVAQATAVEPAAHAQTLEMAPEKKVASVPYRPAAKKPASIIKKSLHKAADRVFAAAASKPLVWNKATTIVKKTDVGKAGNLEGNLRLAIILIVVGLILDIIGGVVPVVGLLFLVIGSILIVVGLIFLLLWLLDQA